MFIIIINISNISRDLAKKTVQTNKISNFSLYKTMSIVGENHVPFASKL